jgi:PAS domain S-box-containing protein
MKAPNRRSRIALYAAVSAIAVAAIAWSWAAVGVAARRPYLELATKTRDLEVAIASQAMAESFKVTIDQSQIIATYSFPEYFSGKRSDDSMRRLLEVQRIRLPGMLIDAYLDSSNAIRFLSRGADAEMALETIVREAPKARERLSSSEGPHVIARAGDSAFFIYYHAVRKGGSSIGLFACGIDLRPAIARYVAPLESRQGRRAYLLGEAQEVLWSSDPKEIGRPLSVAARKPEALSAEGFVLGDYAFRIVACDDNDALHAALRPAETMRDIIVVAAMAALAAIAVMLARLKASEARRRAHAEIESMLAAAVDAREKELAESELRFKTLFEGASDAIVIMTVSGEIIRCNARLASVFGYPAERLVGKMPLDLSPPFQGGRPSGEVLAELMQRGRESFPEPISFEWRFLRSDGSEFESEMSLSIIRTAKMTYTQGIIRDITERKREVRLLQESLEEREVILRELHHRVKNNLQYIESLISLQLSSASGEAKGALAKIHGRVASLASAYLAAADRPETLIIDATKYLEAICELERGASIVDGTRLDIKLDCESLPIGLDAAISLGLILRELLENAAQHGYGRGSGGPVDVALAREGEAAVLRVRDRGAGPAEGWREDLGLTLVRTLASQLSGAVSISAAEPGFSATIRFPLA